MRTRLQPLPLVLIMLKMMFLTIIRMTGLKMTIRVMVVLTVMFMMKTSAEFIAVIPASERMTTLRMLLMAITMRTITITVMLMILSIMTMAEMRRTMLMIILMIWMTMMMMTAKGTNLFRWCCVVENDDHQDALDDGGKNYGDADE